MSLNPLRSRISVLATTLSLFAAGDAIAALCLEGGVCPNECMSTAQIRANGVKCTNESGFCESPEVCQKQSYTYGGARIKWCGCNFETDPECCTAFEYWTYYPEPLPHWQLDAVICAAPNNPCDAGKTCELDGDTACSCQ